MKSLVSSTAVGGAESQSQSFYRGEDAISLDGPRRGRIYSHGNAPVRLPERRNVLRIKPHDLGHVCVALHMVDFGEEGHGKIVAEVGEG